MFNKIAFYGVVSLEASAAVSPKYQEIIDREFDALKKDFLVDVEGYRGMSKAERSEYRTIICERRDAQVAEGKSKTWADRSKCPK